MATLKWRREYFLPVPKAGDPSYSDDRRVLSVEGVYEEVFAREREMERAPIRTLTLLNPPDIRVGDFVRTDDPDVGDPFMGEVVRVGQSFPSRVFNVDLRHPDSGVVMTAACEHCEVVFRPRTRPYKLDEVEALLKDRPNGIILSGPDQSKIAEIFKDSDGSWTAKFPHPIGSMGFDKDWHGLREALRHVNAWFFQKPVQVGDYWTETINQGDRDVEVVAVKKLRYRIEYEMPNAGTMGSWQRGLLIGGKLYAG